MSMTVETVTARLNQLTAEKEATAAQAAGLQQAFAPLAERITQIDNAIVVARALLEVLVVPEDEAPVCRMVKGE